MKPLERQARIAEAAIKMHEMWIKLVNFRHPGLVSSHAHEALLARKAHREYQEAYDEAFAHLTAECELNRQERMQHADDCPCARCEGNAW